MKRTSIPRKVLLFAVTLLMVTACSGGGAKSTNDAGGSGGAAKVSDDGLKKSPKDSIAYQFELLKAGNTDQLRECFTERLRERITPDAVEKGKAQASSYTLEDLVASVEMGQGEGQQTAKIMMKNGRTLTTLVQTDGKWLADTIWFK